MVVVFVAVGVSWLGDADVVYPLGSDSSTARDRAKRRAHTRCTQGIPSFRDPFCLLFLLIWGDVFVRLTHTKRTRTPSVTRPAVSAHKPKPRNQPTDGIFSFITSITAASGHLAPTGYAGSLMGEYNLRFRLADALDQAEALRNLERKNSPQSPSPPPPPGLADGNPTLGTERTEYLAGVLRALPVSEEGFSESQEAAAAAASEASAKAMSAALDMGDSRSVGRGQDGGGTPPRDPDELDEMVKSVQAVLGGAGEPGGLGEGFVEACLSVLGWSPQVRRRLVGGNGGGRNARGCAKCPSRKTATNLHSMRKAARFCGEIRSVPYTFVRFRLLCQFLGGRRHGCPACSPT